VRFEECSVVGTDARYMYDVNNGRRKKLVEAEMKSMTAWEDYHSNKNLGSEAVGWCKQVREAIMKGQVLGHIQTVSPLQPVAG
jgi:hypothetical protein